MIIIDDHYRLLMTITMIVDFVVGSLYVIPTVFSFLRKTIEHIESL